MKECGGLPDALLDGQMDAQVGEVRAVVFAHLRNRRVAIQSVADSRAGDLVAESEDSGVRAGCEQRGENLLLGRKKDVIRAPNTDGDWPAVNCLGRVFHLEQMALRIPRDGVHFLAAGRPRHLV
jgi:hypothetical protein